MRVNATILDLRVPINILTYKTRDKKLDLDSIVWEAKFECREANSLIHGCPAYVNHILKQLPGLINDWIRADEESWQTLIEVQEQSNG